MQSKVELTSLTISKSKQDIPSFLKYNIEAGIDEIENNGESFTMKFSFVILSDTKTIRIGMDGIVTISGSQSERDSILENGDDGIPELVHLLYMRLYSELFMLTKSIDVPCPPYTISKISKTSSNEEGIKSEQIEKDTSVIDKTEILSEANDSINSTIIDTKEDSSNEIIEQNMKSDVKNIEEMTLEELTAEHSRLTDSYSKSPNNEILIKIDKISQMMKDKQKNNSILESPKV